MLPHSGKFGPTLCNIFTLLQYQILAHLIQYVYGKSWRVWQMKRRQHSILIYLKVNRVNFLNHASRIQSKYLSGYNVFCGRNNLIVAKRMLEKRLISSLFLVTL